MAFSRTWNAAYEAQPADVENISLGAGRIRNLKSDIQERLEVDHFHAGDVQDGEHKKLTLGAPIATPANVANKGFLYGKDVGGKIELHWLDEDGNEIALTAAGSINAFPANTSMLFYQSAAPAGWTKDTTTLDNHALRVVSSTAWSGGSKGATGFTSIFGSGAPSSTNSSNITIPAHTHLQFANTDVSESTTHNLNNSSQVSAEAAQGVLFEGYALRRTGTAATVGKGGSTGSGSGDHSHTLSLDLNYINVIRATKD